jgi:hypothetical protein
LITLIVRPSARRRAMSAIEEQIDSSCTVHTYRQAAISARGGLLP